QASAWVIRENHINNSLANPHFNAQINLPAIIK
ncbi:MAG: hypothetical protein ACI8VT_001426, partial [Saprospiraceae bacterium]